ncbi:MAG: M48 family metalloprotease [Candidatus Omnitrophica bacterium]|nr:M48 family metalloprotease [Candidatus Omnitrophota bacterium]
MRFFWLVILSLSLPALLLGCATSDFLGNFNLISPREEEQLGEQLSDEIRKESKEIQDKEIVGYIQAIGQKLVSVSMQPGEPYAFHVIKDDSVNAFAIPGGHIYVHTGLIAAAENEAEIAAVIAHEMGHAENHHPTENMSRAIGAQILTGIILGNEPGALQQAAAGLVANGGLSAYSRSAEREADSTAVFLLNRAGYDPNAIVTFFEKLLAIEKQQGGGSIGISLFSSHPDTVERINNAKAQINTFNVQRASAKEIIGGFQAVNAKVKSMDSTGQDAVKTEARR